MSEKRQFSVHPNLLFDVIQRQAGTLGKAVMEGVMNAVDAGATEVFIIMDTKVLIISDNGKGFRNRYEIEKFFEVFGQPHDPGEKKTFGTFRMGRGQLFAFGANDWQTNNFRMQVNIKKEGLHYKLTEGPTDTSGCEIVVSLYDELSNYDLRATEDEVKRAIKWVAIPVSFNGTVVSKDPTQGTWDLVTDEAYIRFKENGDMAVYNLGVFVRGYGSYQFGCGGEVVSRQQLRLNFARNDVLSTCEAWTTIKKIINLKADQQIKKKKTLTEAQRYRLARQFSNGELDPEEATTMPLFTDVNGRHWSIAKILAKADRYRKLCTLAAKGDGKGDRLMQHGLAFAFADENCERFNVATMVELLNKIKQVQPLWDLQWQPFGKLTRDLNDDFQLLDESAWTPIERATLRTIMTAQYNMLGALTEDRRVRHIKLGRAGAAKAWTDGSTYVAFDREYLRQAGTLLPGWIDVGQALVHEMCHDEPDSCTHEHTPEFYEMYHNSRLAVVRFVEYATQRYGTYLRSENKRLTKAHLAEQDRLAGLGKAALGG